MALRRTHSLEYDLIRILIVLNIWWVGCKLYRNPFRSFQVVSRLVRHFNQMIGAKKLVRAFKINGTYRWDMFNPAWPSNGFNRFFKTHLLELEPITGREQTLRRLIIAITKRCPLQCEHCSEGATLYNRDVLSCDEFTERIENFVQNGVGQLIYTGGEPLNRFDDLLTLLKRFKNRCDQWIYTSGFGLTLEKAQLLKAAGLHGAAISLDQHTEEKHNAFRGNAKSYQWVMDAIKNLQTAGVFVAVNVCPTKEYIESGGLTELVELLKKLDVPVVNLIEPRAVGNYQDKEVELKLSHKNYLSELSDQFNFKKEFFSYPTVLYPAGFRNTTPCGGGRNYLFLDYDGTLYPCPFCKVKMTTVSSDVALCEAV